MSPPAKFSTTFTNPDMTPPSAGTMERSTTTKKVEWGKTDAAEDEAPVWDTEEDHLLSYFLDEQYGGQSNGSQPTFATSGVNHSQAGGSSGVSMFQGGSVTSYAKGDSRPNIDEEVAPPATPALHFYAPTYSSNRRKPEVHMQSSAMAPRGVATAYSASLMMGGPPVPDQTNQQSQKGPPSPALSHHSPISPAALIGPVQEHLMLPPSPRLPPQQMNFGYYGKSEGEKQQHLAWLKEINEHLRAQQGTILPPHIALSNMLPPTAPSPQSYPGCTQAAMYSPAAALQQAQQRALAQSAGESEEKRARRLARNRESARQSRRRKKERLDTLGDKVNKLHHEIETERKKQVGSMNSNLVQLRESTVANISSQADYLSDEELKHSIFSVIERYGPNCAVRTEVVEFLCSSLRQLFLPKYQQFLLWLTLQNETFFTAGKEEYARRDGKQNNRITGRVSSKQVGEELTAELKPPASDDSDLDAILSSTKRVVGDRSTPMAKITDAARMWPLLCFELSVSVDQEDRLAQAHKKLVNREMISSERSQIEAATRTTSRLKDAMLLHSRAASIRNEATFLQVLTPIQAAKYMKWICDNKQRCFHVIAGKKTSETDLSGEMSLLDICIRLDEVLRISKNF